MRCMLVGVIGIVLSACDDDVEPMPDEDLGDPGSCTYYVNLENRWWREALPYIEPTSDIRIYVEGADFIALSGESDPQPDDTTLVWAPKKLHFEDGTIELGAAGNRVAGDPMCEWIRPARVE